MGRIMLIGLAVSVLVLSAASDSARPEDIRKMLTTIVDTPNGTVTAVDLGQPGDSMGDMLVFDVPLLDKNREEVGKNSGFCIRTQPAEFSECQWTLIMADGTITVAGREADRGKSMLTITGGTGAFAGTSGEMASTPNDDGTFTQVLMMRQAKQ